MMHMSLLALTFQPVAHLFPAAELVAGQIDELEKTGEIAEKPIPPMPATYYAGSLPCNTSIHVQIVGDSSTVISWLNCQSVGIGVLAKQIVDDALRQLEIVELLCLGTQ